MARKSRTPPPPRRVQAPQTRAPQRSPEERRRLAILLGVAASGFVGLAAVLLLFAFGSSGGSKSAQGVLEDAGCTLQIAQAEQSGNHVENPPKRSEYNTWPPTSGPHNPVPAPFDVYEEPVEQYRLVHNLEHGGVAIQYGNAIPRAEVDRLIAWYREHPNGIVVAPFPELGRTIALGAWNVDVDASGQPKGSGRGILAKCPRFDEDAFDAYLDAYAFKGPERFPEEQLQPGS